MQESALPQEINIRTKVVRRRAIVEKHQRHRDNEDCNWYTEERLNGRKKWVGGTVGSSRHDV